MLLLLSQLTISCGSPKYNHNPQTGQLNHNFPQLTSNPKVSFVSNSEIPGTYDVTVTIETNEANTISSANLWLFNKDNKEIFSQLNLQYLDGKTWSATTSEFSPLPAGNYYIESISLNAPAPSASGQIRSSKYINSKFLNTYYEIDQKLTDTNNSGTGILKLNTGTSQISVVSFTLS